METLEELKAIIEGKPNNAQSVMMVCNPIYAKLENGFWYAACKGQDWLQVTDKQIGNMRSLSDIERIIELMERVKSGYEAYTRIEAVKQRYNAENKSKAELLLEAEILLRSGTQEHCNILADNIIEALK